MSINFTPANISFELFPARTNAMRFQIGSTIEQLDALHPAFYSVTHGAFDNPGDSSDETITAVAKITNKPVAAHIAASNLPKQELLTWVDYLYKDGVRRFVALRGDGFRKGDNNYYQSALELIQALKAIYHDTITIYVSAYPECHNDATSPEAELQYFQQKILAGGNKAITQFFFDIEKFYRWLDKCKALNLEDKIIAGILPIANYEKTLKMAQYCGTEIPVSLSYQYGKYIDDLASQRALSVDVTLELVDAVRCAGVNDLHFYCLNQADIVAAVCNTLQSNSVTPRAKVA